MDISWSLGGKAKAKAKALAASLLVAWLIIRIRLHGTSTKGKIAAQATGVAGYRPPPPGHGRQVLPPCARIAADRHGLIMKLRMGQKLTVVVSDVDIARECLTTNDRAFAARPKLAVGRILGFDYTSIVCTLELLSTRRLETLSHVRDEETEEGDKVQMGIREHMVDMVINIITRMVGGRSSLRLGPKEEVVEFKELVEAAFYVAGLPNLGDRRQAKQGAVDDEKAVDFLDVMLSLSDDPQIASLSELTPHRRDMIIKATLLVMYAMNFVFSATDTSSVTLEWALAALLNSPEAMRKVKEELNLKVGKERRVEEANIAYLPYLQAIIKEALRLYPPAPILVPHESMEDCMVAGFHRWWEWPLEFEPERFIGSEVDVKGQHFQLLPFGAGRFDWHLPPGCSSLDMTEGMGLTTPRASPLEALMEPSLPFNLLCEN
ncbi:hypothetical protein AMTRI_Chr08g160460 [Amborella trichopoda]